MQINFTGHGMQVTSALREYATDKLDRLAHRGDKITNIHVIFDVEKLQQIAKATVHVPGAELHAHAEAADLYSAIDGLVDKLDQQIKKRREKMKDHHRHEIEIETETEN